MNIQFDSPSANLYNAFHVTQISPGTFLEDLLGLDHIKIAAQTVSEVHRHNHSDNVIFVLRGRAILMLDGKSTEISVGMRIAIPRGVLHGFQTAEDELEFVSAQVPPILDKRTGTFDREILSTAVNPIDGEKHP